VEVEEQWKKLAGRDLQLWSIGFLVMLVMLSGVLSQFAPAIFHGQAIVKFDYRYLPTLSLGLIALVLLLNFYLIGQRRALDVLRYDLIHELAANKSLQHVSMIDPETQLFARAAVSKLLVSEISRANRYGTEITFVMLESRNFEKLRLKGNPLTADRMIVELSAILRQTFRGSDTLFRYSKAEFLVVMPKTSPTEAVPALKRLIENLDHWNLNCDESYELALDYGMSSFNARQPLDLALQEASSNKCNLLSVRSQQEVVAQAQVAEPSQRTESMQTLA
ncbi:MAG TPA: GGDEF domain-containing protein, partial [Terriglobales bacterium]